MTRSFPLWLAGALAVACCGPLQAAQPAGAPQGEVRVHEGGKRLALPAAANAADAEGIRLLAEGRYADAAAAFDRSLKIAKRNPRALANRGTAFAELGRLDDAIRDYEAALILAPELKAALARPLGSARLRRGDARLAAGKLQDALADFYAAARADRKDPRPYAAVASVARRTRQFPTCVGYAGRAADLGATEAGVFADRAACLAALGRTGEALKDLDRAILADNGRADLFASRAFLHDELRRVPAAKRDAQRAVELDPVWAERLSRILRK